MRRGAVIKRSLDRELVLERKTLLTHHVLTLDHSKCIGCGICVNICPEEAPQLISAMVEEGKLIKKALIDTDASKCTFCGECVVLCPTNAVKIEVNGEERIPVVNAEAFPTLTKDITVDVRRCNPLCTLACQKDCVTEAINVVIEKKGEADYRILDVDVDKEKCIFCGRCELICPISAIKVKKPIQGLIRLDIELCSKDCRVCVDVCPSKAIAISQDGKLSVVEEFCIYCGACQKSCPKKAISVDRTQVMHSEAKSGAWIIAFEKLTSSDSLVKELSAKSETKLYEAVSKIR